MKTTILRNGERYFGVDIEPDGSLVVFERGNGSRQAPTRYRPGADHVRKVASIA
jgi:hypothetical protein